MGPSFRRVAQRKTICWTEQGLNALAYIAQPIAPFGTAILGPIFPEPTPVVRDPYLQAVFAYAGFNNQQSLPLTVKAMNKGVFDKRLQQYFGYIKHSGLVRQLETVLQPVLPTDFLKLQIALDMSNFLGKRY
ncbi:hypothetical protein D3C81_1415930 [compost metagenome]